jgi:hypothetical protein
MSVKRYVVKLTQEERLRLSALIAKGKTPSRVQLKARVLLMADEGKWGEGFPDAQIIEDLDTTASMVYRARRTLVEDGIDAVLCRKQRQTPAVSPIFDGAKEARLIQLACSDAPPGRSRWTLRLLAGRVVELGIVEAVSFNTVGRVLKKTRSSRI